MLEKMKEIIADQLSVDADSITEASSFKDDLGADGAKDAVDDAGNAIKKSVDRGNNN